MDVSVEFATKNVHEDGMYNIYYTECEEIDIRSCTDSVTRLDYNAYDVNSK